MGACCSAAKSCPTLTARTVAQQAPVSVGFPRQEYWSGLPRLPPGALPDPGIEPKPPAFQADALTSEPPGIFSSFSSCFRCKVRLFT